MLGRPNQCKAVIGAVIAALIGVTAVLAQGEKTVAIDPGEPTGDTKEHVPSQPKAASLCGEQQYEACLYEENVRGLQAALNTLGYNAGPIDGVYGDQTADALKAYRKSHYIQHEGTPQQDEILDILQLARSIKIPPPKVPQVMGFSPPDRQYAASPSGNVASSAGSGTGAPVPSRVFGGPDQFPPNNFRGYGILAFPTIAGPFDYERHMIFCQAFMNSLPPSSILTEAPMDQFVTVWPVNNSRAAELLNRKSHRSETSSNCRKAIDNYDAYRAFHIMLRIRITEGYALDGLGPYLFGWIPANDFGEAGKLILMLDLSRVQTYEQALIQMQSWQQKIATNPELLRDGFSIENLRRMVRDWSDQHGHAFLVLIGAA